MNWVDWLIIAAAGFGAYRGASTGILRQIASIVGWVVAFVLALQLMEPAGALLVQSLPVAEALAPLVGFVLVLLFVRLAFYGISRVAESVLNALRLSLLNRLGGGLFGAFQGVLVASLLFLVLGALGVPDGPTRRDAAFYRPVAAALPEAWDAVARHLPQVRSAAEQFGRRVEEELPGAEP